MPPHLNGLASRALQMPSEGIVSPAWMLYGHLAEAAIVAIAPMGAALRCDHKWETVQDGPFEPAKIRCIRCGDRNGPIATTSADDVGQPCHTHRVNYLNEPIAIPSRIHDQDEPGSFVAGSNDFEHLAADILNEPFKQQTDRILTQVKSESEADALQTAKLVKQSEPPATFEPYERKPTIDFLALNKASST